MPYQYGMQNSPSGGNGLGGLPKKQTTPKTQTYTRLLGSYTVLSVGTIVPPANAKYMRVAAIGPGGSTTGSGTTRGGGGGGCAASKMVPASPIGYRIDFPSTTANIGTTAIFPGYVLFGGAGGTNVANGVGGIATGGDYNYRGGNAGTFAPGGGAGPFGPGGDGTSAPANKPVLAAEGWGVGGGNGGTQQAAAPGTGSSDNAAATYWGTPATVFGGQTKGGELGGGHTWFDGGTPQGGLGGIVVEWFYD